jgi:hypothetical protein
MKPYIKVALFVVFFVALGGILAGLYMFNLKHKDLSKEKPDVVITAADLQKAFENDEKDATAKYVNKIIEVSGVVSTIAKSDSGSISVTLKTGNDLSSVICTFASSPEASSAKEGDELTLRGECSGFLMDVLLNNCATVKTKK